MKFEKSCGAVIFRNREGHIEFLAVKSKAHGHWGFPKGHVEEGESEEDTAIREVLEETGVDITLVDGFRTSSEYTIYDDTKKEAVYFLARALVGSVNIQHKEIQDYEWADYTKMSKLLTYENDRGILDRAYNYMIDINIMRG